LLLVGLGWLKIVACRFVALAVPIKQRELTPGNRAKREGKRDKKGQQKGRSHLRDRPIFTYLIAT
jgi:hypothetical protein